jgi:phosphoribosylanthranilate isomerase
MIVQIYEIQTPYEAERCIEAGVDHIGSVILSQTNWRKPEIRDVILAGNGTKLRNSIIPLFQDMDIIFKALDYYKPDYIHFCERLVNSHGQYNLEGFIRIQEKIKETFPDIGIIRSIHIPADDAIPGFPTLVIAKYLEKTSDLFLTDTWLGKEQIEGFIGITGRRCNAVMAKEMVQQSKIPIILAGGLSPDNVYDAIMDIHSGGADSCTLTNETDKEGNPIRFKKDFLKVKQFVSEVRRAEKDLLKIKKDSPA